MKSSIAAAATVAALALPTAALARPADTPVTPVTHVAGRGVVVLESPAKGAAHYPPGSFAAVQQSTARTPSAPDGTGTLVVVLIAGGAALAAAGSGFAAGRVRRQHGLAG